MLQKLLFFGLLVLMLSLAACQRTQPTPDFVLCVGTRGSETRMQVDCSSQATECKGPIKAGVYGGAPGHSATATCGAIVATCTVPAGGTRCFAQVAGPATKAVWAGCAGGGGAVNIACGYMDP